MTSNTAKKQASIDTPKEAGGYTLHPATFGLLEWLQSARKNPLVTGGDADLKHVGELCFAFTLPSLEVCRIPPAKLGARVEEFMHAMTPADFLTIQKHAETELLKFEKTAVVPKKKPARKRVKVKRK
jgi:hypothetical protein